MQLDIYFFIQDLLSECTIVHTEVAIKMLN